LDPLHFTDVVWIHYISLMGSYIHHSIKLYFFTLIFNETDVCD